MFIPSTYHLTEDNFLTNWDGDVVLAKLVHYPMWFKDGEIKGKNALIFDDEVDTAGSIMETVRVVKQFGAKDVYVGCTHGILSGPAIDRIDNSELKELVMTNTVPLPDSKKINKITVGSISNLFGEAIKRIHEATSIGELFEPN